MIVYTRLKIVEWRLEIKEFPSEIFVIWQLCFHHIFTLHSQISNLALGRINDYLSCQPRPVPR